MLTQKLKQCICPKRQDGGDNYADVDQENKADQDNDADVEQDGGDNDADVDQENKADQDNDADVEQDGGGQ